MTPQPIDPDGPGRYGAPVNSEEPNELRWEDDGERVGITWSDGHESAYTLEYLRRVCPCAVCTTAHADAPISTKPEKRFNILTQAQVSLARTGARVRSCEPVGHYAITFTWDDGHDDGIYSYRYLRQMCPCAECAAQR